MVIIDWKPISSAPSGRDLLLGWSEGGEGADGNEYDSFVNIGPLHDGEWLDGPGPQPDWWAELPSVPKKRIEL